MILIRTLEEIRAKLQDRKLAVISAVTGLHINTIRDVRDNLEANPSYRVLKALSIYFDTENGVGKK